MADMNAIQKVERELRKALGSEGVVTSMDAPDDKTSGTWWLDIALGKQRLAVQWNRRHGFGVSAPGAGGYGEGADETGGSVDEVLKRIVHLLKSGEKPQPPEEVLLRRLREIRSVSQQELARRLGISQATVSKIERRSDMYISTLRRMLAAIGGELEIQARFPDRTVTIRQFTDLEQPPAAPKRARGGRGRSNRPR